MTALNWNIFKAKFHRREQSALEIFIPNKNDILAKTRYDTDSQAKLIT